MYDVAAMSERRIVAAGLRCACLLALLFGVIGCGTVTSTWPLRRGASSVNLSAGGPVANIGGFQLPIPYAVGRYRYGITDRVGAYATAHLLMAGFGVAGGDAGVTWHFVDQHGLRPCIGMGAGAIGFAEFDGGSGRAFFPTAELTASYMRGRHSLTYAGVHGMLELDPLVHGTYTPYIGQEVNLGNRLSLNLELKWYGAWERTKPRAVTYTMPIANHGGMGFAAGINYYFGSWYR